MSKVKLLKTVEGEATTEVIKEYNSIDEAENRFEELRNMAINRYLDKTDFDCCDFLNVEQGEDYISLMNEYYK